MTQKQDNTKQPASIKDLFNTIADSYDLANHVLSLWTDCIWRKTAAKLTEPMPDDSLLDMCCGTGDLVLAFAKVQPLLKSIIGCDFSEEMLYLAKEKGAKLSDLDIQWRYQDCLNTNFDNNSFDIISCAFGIRNMADLQKGLAEMHRLLKPSGKVCILEFSLPMNPVIRQLYLLYFRFVLPMITTVITKNTQAYEHLTKSVIKWDAEINLQEELQTAGFENIQIHPHTFGLATTHLAQKPKI